MTPPPHRRWIVEAVNAHERFARECDVLLDERSPHQRLLVVRSPTTGLGMLLDGRWQLSESDEFIYHETLVQVPMVLHGGARKVALLGAGDGAALREVLRWNSVESVTIVEIDEAVLRAAKKFLGTVHQEAFNDKRVDIVVADAGTFLKAQHETWDVMIADVTDPLPGGPAEHLFTADFFRQVARSLAPAGVFCTQAGRLWPTTVSSFHVIRNTMATIFEDILPFTAALPTYLGSWAFLAARHGKLSAVSTYDFDRICPEEVAAALRHLDGRSYAATFALPRFAL